MQGVGHAQLQVQLLALNTYLPRRIHVRLLFSTTCYNKQATLTGSEERLGADHDTGAFA
jgi:hypothetical protein